MTGATTPGRLPAAFVGAWGENVAACRPANRRDQFVVTATGWSQGMGEARFVLIHQMSPQSYRVGVLLDGESDGKPALWTLLDNGARLRIAPGDGVTDPFTYLRCGRTAR